MCGMRFCGRFAEDWAGEKMGRAKAGVELLSTGTTEPVVLATKEVKIETVRSVDLKEPIWQIWLIWFFFSKSDRIDGRNNKHTDKRSEMTSS